MLRVVYACGGGALPCPCIVTQKLALKGAGAVCLRSDIDDFGRVSVASIYERHNCERLCGACRGLPPTSRIGGVSSLSVRNT